MKKKLLAASLVIALLAIAVVGGSLAWLQDSKAVTNTFTVGQVKIDLTEPGWSDNAKLVPGAVIAKDPTVTVKANSEKCKVYVKVEVPANLAALVDLDIDTTNWLATGVTGVYAYKEDVSASATENTVLPKVFSKVTVKGTATNEQLAALSSSADSADLKIKVTAYAIQADNLGTTDPLVALHLK